MYNQKFKIYKLFIYLLPPLRANDKITAFYKIIIIIILETASSVFHLYSTIYFKGSFYLEYNLLLFYVL